MVQIDATYLGELRCSATHAPSGNVLTTDAPKDNHGLGEAFSPTDLLATALGTCMLTIMGISARKHGLDLAGAAVRVIKEMAPPATPPRRVARLTVTFTLPAHLSPEQRTALENAAKSCPVHHSLHPDLVTDLTFNYV